MSETAAIWIARIVGAALGVVVYRYVVRPFIRRVDAWLLRLLGLDPMGRTTKVKSGRHEE